MPACAPPEDIEPLRIDAGANTWVNRFELRSAEGRLMSPSPGLRSLTWTRLDDGSPDAYATLAVLAHASFPRIFYHFD